VVCTSALTSAGGKRHRLRPPVALINTNCGSCHEAGTNLIGTLWNGATGGGFRRRRLPSFTLASADLEADHPLTRTTLPVDCNQCHVVPAGNGNVTTGATSRPRGSSRTRVEDDEPVDVQDVPHERDP